MASPDQRQPRRLRRIFKWFGILMFLGVLVVALAGLYLNRVGVPDFLKRPLLAKLQAKGIQLDFDRMRLRWYRGLVVDRARFTFLKPPLHPQFSSDEAEFDLNYRSLFDSDLKWDSLTIKQGKLIWPTSKTNQLSLSNITTRIQFEGSEVIDISKFQADFIGAHINLSGTITNALEMKDWKIFQPKTPRVPKRGLGQIAAMLEKIEWSGTPELTLNIFGDAAKPENFRGELKFSAASANTPWGSGTNVQLSAQVRDFLKPSKNNFIRLKTASAKTRWGSATNLNCLVRLDSISANREMFQTEVKFFARQVNSKFGDAGSLRLNGHSTQAWTNLVPALASGTLNVTNAETKWGKASTAEIVFAAATNTSPKLADASWAAWSKAEPFRLNWEARTTDLETPKIKVEKLFSTGSWLSPVLKITALEGELYGGGIQLTGQLNVATRQASARTSTDFDVQKVSPFLSPFGKRWIAKYTWEKPPKTLGEVSVVLPTWTNSSPNWQEEVLPTLMLSGSASVGHGTYRNVTATSAHTTFVYSSMVWTLPRIHVERPEGSVDLSLLSDDRTRSFLWRIESEIDPKAIRHLLEEKQQLVFDDFQFTTPPKIRGELRGYWFAMEETSVDGEIAVLNFSYRSNKVDKLNCSLVFTNQNLQVTELRLEKEDKFIEAKKVELDLPTKKMFFTDVYATVDGHLVAGLIGRKVAEHIAPYQFVEPPAVRLNGSLTIGKSEEADLHFLVDGTQFQWKQFQADRISGQLDWVKETLLVTNVQARAYGGGRIAGWSDFDFAVTNGAAYRFDIAAADVDLKVLMKSFSDKTNHLEGLLHGQMTLESGNTGDPKTMRGNGQVNLRDGVVWDVPVFGLFSPILNAIVPGSGNSRAREASAKFTVADGIIKSDDLEIRAPTVRLQYRGSVDFQQNIDARVEAELLRDAWVIGRVVSLALTPLSKVFEYKVSGTLSKPESEPVYIPEFLMMTLRPFHSIKKAFTPDKEPSGTVPGTSAIPP